MLKLQYFGHLMRRTNSFEVWASSGSWWWTGKPGMLQSMGSQRVGHNWMTQLNWTVKLYLDPMSCVLSSLACPALCPPEMLSLILSVWWTLLYPSRWGMGYKWHVLCETFLDLPTQSVSFSSILAATYLSCSYNQILLKVKYVYIVPFLCQMVCSITQSCLTLCNSMDCSPPGSSSMEFSRQEYWRGLPFPAPEDLPDLLHLLHWQMDCLPLHDLESYVPE